MTLSDQSSFHQPLTQVQMARCLDVLRKDFEHSEVIYLGADRVLIRCIEQQSGQTIVIKMWSRPDLKGKIRRLLRIAACDHESRSMTRLHRFNMAVPCPLGTYRVRPAIFGYTDALFMEDLGQCESSTEFLKRLIREGDSQKILRFEESIIEMTEQIVLARMLDVDHGFVNTVVQASGQPVRLDFELARWVGWPRMFPGMYGQMLGHMILLHAFAVQPDTARTTLFAERLRDRMRPSPRALKNASIYIQEWLHDQLRRSGIDTRLHLPWD
jgi:hypothetical protein